MPNRNNLKSAAVKIGSAMGKADRTAHKVGNAGQVAKQELLELKKQIQMLTKQLDKSTKKLTKALR